jgi:hypothetical protein
MLAADGDARCQLFVPPHGFGNHLPLLGIDHALLNTFPKPLRQGHALPQREIDSFSSKLFCRHIDQLAYFGLGGNYDREAGFLRASSSSANSSSLRRKLKSPPTGRARR